jgi:carboxypeptidase Q
MKNVVLPSPLIVLLACLLFPLAAPPATRAATTSLSTNDRPAKPTDTDAVARIRGEGLNRSQVMDTLSYLTDVIGPRLTGSPQMKRANEWTRDKLAAWGLKNAHLDSWGHFGRGWSIKSFSAQVTEPQAIPLIAFPKAWSPGFERPITAEVVYLEGRTEADWAKYKGMLKGAIVLASPVREVRARFEPLATRIGESNLLRLANAPEPGSTRASPRTATNAIAGARRPQSTSAPPRVIMSNLLERAVVTNIVNPTATLTNVAAPRTRTNQPPARALDFLIREGAAVVITPSSQGDGGTIFVTSASTPGSSGRSNATRVSVYATNAPAIPAQIALGTEDYNRLVRMIKQGEKVKMKIDLHVEFHDEDPTGYNTVAEIPGSDLKDEVVMLGAHLDSWHCGTGATDNAAGVAAAMEALRILRALDLQPRRTIRVALWTGEEQGLLGSRGYVAKHFGYYTNVTNVAARSPRAQANEGSRAVSSRSSSTRKLVRRAGYEEFSAYYNLDNGTGKIRGVYMQGNEAVRPLFRKWLQPFNDLGAETLTLANTGGTDHLSFDGIGLPGFQFIQDPIDYFTRTHHSTADVFDRIQADDMKQAATIMAAFVYNTAMLDEKLPRKPLEEIRRR